MSIDDMTHFKAAMRAYINSTRKHFFNAKRITRFSGAISVAVFLGAASYLPGLSSLANVAALIGSGAAVLTAIMALLPDNEI